MLIDRWKPARRHDGMRWGDMRRCRLVASPFLIEWQAMLTKRKVAELRSRKTGKVAQWRASARCWHDSIGDATASPFLLYDYFSPSLSPRELTISRAHTPPADALQDGTSGNALGSLYMTKRLRQGTRARRLEQAQHSCLSSAHTFTFLSARCTLFYIHT